MSQDKVFENADKLVTDKSYPEFPSTLPQISCQTAGEYQSMYQANQASAYQRLALGMHLAYDEKQHTADCPYHWPGLIDEIRSTLEVQ